jgi:hypothetical protein
MKKLKVSIAQISCIDGEVEKNLAHASELAPLITAGSMVVTFSIR